MSDQDTTIRISREEKQVLDMARNVFERKTGRQITAGEFVRFLAQHYLRETGAESGQEMPGSAGLVAAQEVKPAQPQLVSPGPQVLLVTCVRCGGHIGWRVDLGSDGYCPYCGVYLRLMR